MKKPPTSLNEEFINRLHLRDRMTGAVVPDDVLQTMADAMASARGSAEQTLALAAALRGDRTMTPEAGLLRLREKGLKLAATAAAKLDAAKQRALHEIEHIGSETYAPPPPKDQLAADVEREVRSTLKAMSSAARNEAFTDALKSNDQAVLSAILRTGVPPFLMGMSEAELELKRYTWRRKHHAAAVDREARLKKAVDAVDRGGRALCSFAEEVTGGSEAKMVEAGARLARDAIASVTEE